MDRHGTDAERLRTFLKRDFPTPYDKKAGTALTVLEPFFSIGNGDMPVPLVRASDGPLGLIRKNLHLFVYDPNAGWDIHALDPQTPSPNDFLPYISRRCKIVEGTRRALFLEGNVVMNEFLAGLKRQFRKKIQERYPQMRWKFLDELETRLAAPFHELMDAVIRGDADLTPHLGRLQLFLVGIYPVPFQSGRVLFLPVAPE